MSVHMTNGPSHAHRTPRAEFYGYYALIFIVALPFAVLGWSARAVIARKLPAQNPISRAWGHARAITPSIFRA
jgi:hypothetical protein